MSKITFSTLILSTLMISACGGSGGSSHSDPQPIPSTPSNSPTTTTTPSTQQEPTPAATPSNSHPQAAEKTATSQPHQITPPTQQEPTQAATPSNSHPQAAEKTAESQAQQERPQAQRPPVTPSVPSTHLTRSDLTISQDEFKKGMLENITVRSGNTKVGTLSGYNRTYSFNGAFKKEEGKDIQTSLLGKYLNLLPDSPPLSPHVGLVLLGMQQKILHETFSTWEAKHLLKIFHNTVLLPTKAMQAVMTISIIKLKTLVLLN